jgi:hypothetical protein
MSNVAGGKTNAATLVSSFVHYYAPDRDALSTDRQTEETAAMISLQLFPRCKFTILDRSPYKYMRINWHCSCQAKLRDRSSNNS